MRFNHTLLALTIGLALTQNTFAADTWTGFYAELAAGELGDVDDDNDSIRFDTDLDGGFNDTVSTASGADAFSPGFCDGIARERTPAGGCIGNVSEQEWAARLGYDWQRDDWVFGALFEYADPDIRDAVSAFSTTPARYTMIRKVDEVIALRGRIGFTMLDGKGLLYGTGGLARASISNSFFTSNAVNTFVDNGDGHANGTQFGIGYSHRFGDHLSVGLEYLLSNFDDDDARVRAQGPAPATNPFIRTNPNGTDFARSDEDLDFDSIRLSVGWRF